MTPAQAAWLRKLRDEGPSKPNGLEWIETWKAEKGGLCDHDPNTWAQCKKTITPAGLAALEAYERNKE